MGFFDLFKEEPLNIDRGLIHSKVYMKLGMDNMNPDNLGSSLKFFKLAVAAKPDHADAHACLGQSFVARGAVAFIWTTIPYRMEWRYSLAAHRVILIDAGHVCQNLYLACEAIQAGTCAVAAYDQELLDELLAVDGKDEFAVYLAPVGKI